MSYVPPLDAHGDVLRGLQVVETACGAASALLGEKIEVSKDMDTETRRLPLGVCARLVRPSFTHFMEVTQGTVLHLSTSLQ
jgi:acyl-CoA reductase-like NAD-dependent aldehyde dehydrogenase